MVFHTAVMEQLGTSRGGVLILPVITVSFFGSVRSDLTNLLPFMLHLIPQSKYFDVRSSVRKAHPTSTMVDGFDHLSWLA